MRKFFCFSFTILIPTIGIAVGMSDYKIAGLGEVTCNSCVKKSVACKVTVDDGVQVTFFIIKRDLRPNDEGGLGKVDLDHESDFKVSAYSSSYKLDRGNRLFLTVGDILVSSEADQRAEATLKFTHTGNATYTYRCIFD